MKLTSVRARLTLWNVGVLALTLIGFAVVVQYTVKVRLLASIDQEMARNAGNFADRYSQFYSVYYASPSSDPEGKHKITLILNAVAQLKRQLNPQRGHKGQGANSPQATGQADTTSLDVPASLPPQPGNVAVSSTGLGQASFPIPNRRPPLPPGLWPQLFKGEKLLLPDSKPTLDRREMHAERVFDLHGHALFPFLKERPWGNTPWDASTFARSARGEEVYSLITYQKEPLRIFSRPLINRGTIFGVIQIARPLSEMRPLIEGLYHTLFFLVPLALLAAGVGGAFLTGRSLRPVRQLRQAAEELGADDLSRRLPTSGGDEFAELASTFNRMIARVENSFTRLEEALEQQQRFTADASHELRTPLTTIKGNTSLALRGKRTAEEYQQALAAADRAADMMNHILQDLLLLARSDNEQMNIGHGPVCLREVLQDALTLAMRERSGASVTLDVADTSLLVTGDANHLTRLFLNLLENARRHTPEEGRIVVSAHGEGDRVLVTVADTGEGIPPEHLPHVCERFYRVDAARSRAQGGSGLGLAICRSIVEAHRGSLTLQSVFGQGVTVTVTLPRDETILDESEESDVA